MPSLIDNCLRKSAALTGALLLAFQPALAQAGSSAVGKTLRTPKQILKTGINLNETTLSPNSKQLADILKLTPLLERLKSLRARVPAEDTSPTLQSISNRVALLETDQKVRDIIQSAALSIDFTVAEIYAEHQVYNEILGTYQARADRAVFMSNMAAYRSNGVLWAVAEGLDIPTFRTPKFSIPSGITGIVAGVIPSIFSLHATRAVNGRKYPGESEPNMLAMIFNVGCTTEVEYPEPVWDFLHSVPPDDSSGKTRIDQLIHRWVVDENVPSFTDPKSRDEVETVTAFTDKKKVVTIAVLQTRIAMLSQLAAEVEKMKRMLYELSLTAQGEKQI